MVRDHRQLQERSKEGPEPSERKSRDGRKQRPTKRDDSRTEKPDTWEKKREARPKTAAGADSSPSHRRDHPDSK